MINEIYDDGGGALIFIAAAIYITLLIYFSIRAVVFYTVVSVAIEHLHRN